MSPASELFVLRRETAHCLLLEVRVSMHICISISICELYINEMECNVKHDGSCHYTGETDQEFCRISKLTWLSGRCCSHYKVYDFFSVSYQKDSYCY